MIPKQNYKNKSSKKQMYYLKSFTAEKFMMMTTTDMYSELMHNIIHVQKVHDDLLSLVRKHNPKFKEDDAVPIGTTKIPERVFPRYVEEVEYLIKDL